MKTHDERDWKRDPKIFTSWFALIPYEINIHDVERKMISIVITSIKGLDSYTMEVKLGQLNY
jgi:hypothetical protein